MDYAFFRDAPGGPCVPVIVLKHRQSKAIAAHTVPYKGGDAEWAVAQCVRDIRKWGLHSNLIIRSDQEDALKALVNEVIAGLEEARRAVGNGAGYPSQSLY